MERLKRWQPGLHSLSAQTILTSVTLVLLTAVAAGVPAVLMIREQLDHEAWSQVDQGSRASMALYAAKQSELIGLATLTAQRPTLYRLLAAGDREALLAYLRTLQEGSGLDLVIVCGSDSLIIAQTGGPLPDSTCALSATSGFVVAVDSQGPQAWLLAQQPASDQADELLGAVIVGVLLDDHFAAQMRDQTGLEHSLLVAGRPVATSLPGRHSWSPEMSREGARATWAHNGQRYYATYLPLDAGDLEAEMALEVTNVALAQRRLGWTLASTIFAVVVVASLLGTYLARRIAQPLARLAETAEAMRQGDLDVPLAFEPRVREVALVAQALDGARADLKRTLGELRQEKAWTDHLLEAIVEGIVTLDRKGSITYFSQGAEQITGWRRDEVMGRTCDQVFNLVESAESFSQLIPPPGRRRKIAVELRDGRQAILAMTGARLLPPQGGDARVALVFRDVSEEEAMHRLLGHFMANIAHEFRTPLSALAASVELLMDQASDLTPDELAELLASLHLGVLGLQTLIDNLLESASIEAGRFRVHARASDLQEIVAEAIRTMQPLLDKRQQRLTIEMPAILPDVQADPRRTVQVLVNLLSNASKYGPDDAEIEVVVTVQGKWARVAVADSGSGVPAEYRSDLFRRFVHPQSGNHKAQMGVGLGLSVVKAIVDAHGGQVGIGDRKGGGAEFWFTLPLAEET